MAVAVFSTFWGHFNHSNLDVGLGRLGYVFNSPRMHLWHHDRSDEGGTAKNFGIVLSVWDFLFGTAYWPRGRTPAALGYPGDAEMPRDLPRQLVFPLLRTAVNETPPRSATTASS
jgi:sterol desaturase/sphingolipid hydroxylase (fatty acid hydroxylase superfamily)